MIIIIIIITCIIYIYIHVYTVLLHNYYFFISLVSRFTDTQDDVQEKKYNHNYYCKKYRVEHITAPPRPYQLPVFSPREQYSPP